MTNALLRPDVGAIKDYRLTVRIRNNRLLTYIERAGFRTVVEFCAAHYLPYQSVTMLIRLARPVWTHHSGWLALPLQLAEIFKVPPEELFRGRALLIEDLRVRVEREVDEAELVSLTAGETRLLTTTQDDPETAVISKDIAAKLLDYLSDRERTVVTGWLGLDGPALKLEEIAELIPYREGGHPSYEGVRQILIKAIGRMRRRAVQLRLLSGDQVSAEGELLDPEAAKLAAEVRRQAWRAAHAGSAESTEYELADINRPQSRGIPVPVQTASAHTKENCG